MAVWNLELKIEVYLEIGESDFADQNPETLTELGQISAVKMHSVVPSA
jgi:hypothetical protein